MDTITTDKTCLSGGQCHQENKHTNRYIYIYIYIIPQTDSTRNFFHLKLQFFIVKRAILVRNFIISFKITRRRGLKTTLKFIKRIKKNKENKKEKIKIQSRRQTEQKIT